jgi:hypothetical protein
MRVGRVPAKERGDRVTDRWSKGSIKKNRYGVSIILITFEVSYG